MESPQLCSSFLGSFGLFGVLTEHINFRVCFFTFEKAIGILVNLLNYRLLWRSIATVTVLSLPSPDMGCLSIYLIFFISFSNDL